MFHFRFNILFNGCHSFFAITSFLISSDVRSRFSSLTEYSNQPVKQKKIELMMKMRICRLLTVIWSIQCMAAPVFNMMKRLRQIRDAIYYVQDLLTCNWPVEYPTVIIYWKTRFVNSRLNKLKKLWNPHPTLGGTNTYWYYYQSCGFPHLSGTGITPLKIKLHYDEIKCNV